MASYRLEVYYQNARGLRTKTHVFKRNLLMHSYDIIAITETWLIEGITDSELFDDRYVIWRRDRDYIKTKERYGGGVLIAVRRDLAAKGCSEWCSSAEDVWVTITIKTNANFIRLHLCTLYLCQENHGYSFSAQLQNFTSNLPLIINSSPDDLFLIMGDFNLSNVNWHYNENNHLCPSGIAGTSQTYFFDTLLECSLYQFNACTNINNRLLDLIFCNNEITVEPCNDPLVSEDPHHKSLNIVLKFPEKIVLRANSRLKYFYNKGDYYSINSALNNINWEVLRSTPLEIAIETFYNNLYNLINAHIPHKMITPSTYPPWYNSSLKKLLKEKFKFLKKYRIYGNTSDFNTFCLLRTRAKSLEQECYESYIKRSEDAITKNPKMFWSFTKSNKKGSNLLPSTLYYEDQSADAGDHVCDLFANYFDSTFLSSSSMSNTHDSLRSCDTESDCLHNIISDIEIETEAITKMLKSLDLSKGPGPDKIAPRFVVECALTLAGPLSILFKRSVSEGIVPKIWKSAFITPIHKSGSRNEVKNYRPISKLCIFAKIFERIIYNQVYNTLTSFFIPQQHGFLKKRSTTSNLLTFIDYTTFNIESGGQVDAIFTDYKKAFDRIDHKLLLQKLLFAGIHGNLFRWFSSYIQNRSQAVVVNGFSSSWRNVPSGVPQGSLLGPLLFNIFVNNISSCFKYSQFLLYADDLKIYRQITSLADCDLLQKDLDSLEHYCKKNKLELNINKCYAITFTRKPKPIEYKYSLHEQQLQRVHQIRDLGVLHDSKLMYDMHIDSIVNKANKAMGFILRSCSQLNSLKVIKILYCSFVRSTLEYCSQVWNPQYELHINRIEAIQRRFLRYLQFKFKCNDPNYEQRCKRHHILPLKQRRRIADILYLVKIAQNIIDSPSLLSKIHLRVPSRSQRQPIFLATQVCSTRYRQNSFFVRSANEYNKLADQPELDLFNSKANLFKKILSTFWFDQVL